MRTILLVFLFLVLAAFVWALQAPLACYAAVKALSTPGADAAACEDTLRRSGNAAIPALKGGLNSMHPVVRLHCARLLALCGDRSGDSCLLELLRAHGSAEEDTTAEMAESYLLTVWEERGAPTAPERMTFNQMETDSRDSDELAPLNQTLITHPLWATGYVRRARLYQRSGNALEARRDALVALMLEADDFEAMLVLSLSYLNLNAPEQAYLCMERAVLVNPRLRGSQREDIRELLKALDADRARKRREKRRDVPLAGSVACPII